MTLWCRPEIIVR